MKKACRGLSRSTVEIGDNGTIQQVKDARNLIPTKLTEKKLKNEQVTELL